MYSIFKLGPELRVNREELLRGQHGWSAGQQDGLRDVQELSKFVTGLLPVRSSPCDPINQPVLLPERVGVDERDEEEHFHKLIRGFFLQIELIRLYILYLSYE